jgi:mannose-1-phosphate guanylyltransferase
MASENNLDLSIVIMAGGAGTRFWPLSTENVPKQFLKLFGNRSLLQQSYDRVASLVPTERILVLTNEAFVPLVKEQLPNLPDQNIIGEPMRRDTAAAVALAALLCKKRFGNTVMGIMTADHLIAPVDIFHKTLLSAVKQAAQGNALYTLGIEPTFPATGYGYLESSNEVLNDGGTKHYELKQFKEKPDVVTASKYLKTGRFFWNSGMFVWSVDAITAEFNKQLPAHLENISKAVEKDGTNEWDAALKTAFEPLEKISIDFGIMEKAENVRTVAAGFSWSDVGGWLALEEYLQKDGSGNAHRGNIETYEADSNLIFCEDGDETVALVGVDDLIVVRAGNRTLIADKKRTEDIKKLVEKLDKSLK